MRAPRKGRQASANPSRRVEPADGEEAHLEAALVDRRQPAQDANGEQVLAVDRDAVEAHAAERRPGEEVRAGAARQIVCACGRSRGGQEAHLEAALVDRRQPAQDADGERYIVVDRDGVEAHAAELQAGEEVGAGAARRLAERLAREQAGAPATLDAAETTMSMTADKGS